MKISFKNIFKIITSSFFFFTKISFTFFITANICTVANMDASHPWQVGFQDPATPIMEGIIFFNGLLMTFMIFIASLVGWLLYKSLSLFNESVHNNPVGFTHSTLLEVVWTIIPAAILMIISVPSYNLLYAMDEVIDPSLTIKVVGHQWYWSYECSDFEVAPHLQKVDSAALDEARKDFEFAVRVLEYSHKEADKGETQTQLKIANDYLNLLNEKVDKLPEEASLILARRIDWFNFLMQMHENRKDYYHPNGQDYSYGELADIISNVKKELNTSTNLLPEQIDEVIKLLETYKKCLRITDDEEFVNLQKSFTADLISQSNNFLFDNKGSGNSKNSGSDDSSDDDGSIISDLIHFDKSNSNWDWCESVSVKSKYDQDNSALLRAGSEALLSERICNSAALFPEEDSTPFPELVEKMIKDFRELNRVKPIVELSEDKLIDTQLIDHQLRLTRAEREGYSSKYALDTSAVISDYSNRQLNIALDELNNAKLHLHWSNIELAAAKVNKLTAEYLQADASLGVTDPLLIRSLWINQKGYYSWNHFLRLAAKKLSDAERLVFLNADEELNGANSLLGKAQRDLTQEELIRSNAIADNAKAEFMAMEREMIPAVEEFYRGKIILENAEADLKSFQEISNRAAVRLEKAEIAFNKVKPIADRATARLNAAESVYNNAQSKLTKVNLISELVDPKESLKEAQKKFDSIKEEFDNALSKLQDFRRELLIAEDRLKTVIVNLIKTEKVFEDTGILEKQTPVKGKPIEYYPNHLWEIHNEDYAFVKAQLKTDIAELGAVKTSVSLAEEHLSSIGSILLEAELIKSKALIEVLKSDSNNVASLNDEINHFSSIKLGIAEAIYAKALNDFKTEGSNMSELIFYRAEKGLVEAKLNGTSGYLNSFLKNNFKSLDSNKLVSDYAEMCLLSANDELIGAEKDYEKAASILKKAKIILDTVTSDLSKDYKNPYLNILKYLHKNTSLSLKKSIDQLASTKIEFSPLDIKLEPGLLQSKSYKEVLLAKSELANIKWLAARVAKTLDIPLNEEVKPFNVQFSHLNTDNSLNTDGVSLEENNFSSEGDLPSDDSGDKDPSKRQADVNKTFSILKSEEFSNNPSGFKKKFLSIYSELLKTLTKDDTKLLLPLIDKSLSAMGIEEHNKNDELRRHISNTVEELAYWKEEEEKDVERINFDSYLIADDDLVIPEASGTGKAGKVFRLLEVDNRLFVPTNTHIRLLVTSADVLHSWAVPSLGIKVDACPGRLNQVFLFVKREGVFYGQCSELCGVNHGFMPIVVQAVSQDEYLTWVGKRLCS